MIVISYPGFTNDTDTRPKFIFIKTKIKLRVFVSSNLIYSHVVSLYFSNAPKEIYTLKILGKKLPNFYPT